ncbi:MAG: glycosyltransferase [Planctomycetes bacterium]|nr:glycosyltransferase [Planctomycetota bacterium]
MPEIHERPPIASAPLSVILFANALDTETQEGLHRWRGYLATLGREHEIVLLQETRPEVSPADTGESSLRTITYERTTGIRDALNEAIRSARHPLVVFCPCDLQYQPIDLERMVKVIDKVDLVTGYRGGGHAPPWRVMLDLLLGILSRLMLGIALEPRACWLGGDGWGRRWTARWVFGVRVLDPECPFRLARRAVFEHLPFQSGGPFVQVEMLAKANHLGCYLAEEPVSWTPPALPAATAISFAQDAGRVFRDPDFGRYGDPAALSPAG